MTLVDAFASYLAAPSPRASAGALIDALGDGSFEARLLRAWCDGRDEGSIDQGAWCGVPVRLSERPPEAASPGDLWLDVCELALMLHAGRAWLAAGPTRVWQMAGFLALQPFRTHEVQIAPPYRSLDASRLVGQKLPSDAVTSVTEGEATLYSWWLGKSLPHIFDWQEADEQLPATAMRELWSRSAKEWVSTRIDEDEGARVAVTPATLQWDPDDVFEDERDLSARSRTMIHGEYTRDPGIGFRTAVLLQVGLLDVVTAWHALAENLRLTELLERDRFC